MSKWISVDERLPEENTPVLVCYIGYNDGQPHTEGVACINYGSWCWYEDIDADNDEEAAVTITHWMPLPEPPGKQTNADRIRDMGDDELAQFLCEFRSCDAETHPCNKCKAAPFCRAGHTGMIDWLQSPAEEG